MCWTDMLIQKSRWYNSHKPPPPPPRQNRKTELKNTRTKHKNTLCILVHPCEDTTLKFITMIKQRRVLLANPSNIASQSCGKPLVEPRQAKPDSIRPLLLRKSFIMLTRRPLLNRWFRFENPYLCTGSTWFSELTFFDITIARPHGSDVFFLKVSLKKRICLTLFSVYKYQ